MTTVTTDKHVANLNDSLVVSDDGLRHYAVLVEELPDLERFEVLEPILPFYVAMCELCDAYDAAKGWSDFSYPNTKFVAVEHGYPTCARCSGA
jgi:hypothetical protein